MSRLKLRIKLNKGQRGVPLAKLESFIGGLRRFLAAASRDLDIPNSEGWAGVEFRNGSVEWTNESPLEVPPPVIGIFNTTITQLSKGQISPYIEPGTNANWAEVFQELDPREQVGIAIYPPDKSRAKWLKITREIAMRTAARPGLHVRESIGAIQGTVHTWYRESEPPYFTLRESSSRALIKCFYRQGDYGAVVQAVESEYQVIHVHGKIFTDTVLQCVREISTDRIIPSEPFSFSDFEKVWNRGKTQ